jgi:F-type H+-transporting ATPase subunit gamma
MPNTKELRRRIRSVKNMSQITKAMQMVAATKMRRAQNQAISGRPYTTTLNRAVLALLPKLNSKTTHPLLKPNNSEKAAALVITTDKGLCGSLNTNIFKAITTFISENKDPQFYTIGKKGRNFLAKSGKDLIADFENSDSVTFRTASQIGKLVSSSFINNEIGSFSVIYPNFVSALRQEPQIMRLLPIDLESLKEFYDMALEDTKKKENTEEKAGEFLFEPNLPELLDFIITHYVQVKIYQALLETKASEHSARMIAMQNATDNAKELASDLTLSYNQTRQESITKELLEITSALAALE